MRSSMQNESATWVSKLPADTDLFMTQMSQMQLCAACSLSLRMGG